MCSTVKYIFLKVVNEICICLCERKGCLSHYCMSWWLNMCLLPVTFVWLFTKPFGFFIETMSELNRMYYIFMKPIQIIHLYMVATLYSGTENWGERREQCLKLLCHTSHWSSMTSPFHDRAFIVELIPPQFRFGSQLHLASLFWACEIF